MDTSTLFAVGQAPITYQDRSFSVTVPLALLGNDDGLVNYGIIVGDVIAHSDEATNFGEPVAFTIPEPCSLPFFTVGAIVVLVTHRRRSLHRSPRWRAGSGEPAGHTTG